MAKRFTINVPQSKIDELHERLEATHFPPALGKGWDYGTDIAYMKELLAYWQKDFHWRAAEAKLNEFTQFTTDVNGTSLHFIHEKSDNPNATPLLLIHGWPDSFYRFYKVIPLLKKNFHVVVPSLPGFGFSEKVAMNSKLTADLLASLMHDELDYDKFAVSGGDIGTSVIRHMAVDHKTLVSAVHLTDMDYPLGNEDFSTMTPAEQAFAGQCQRWWYTEGAYTMEQSTKPQTLVYGLSDSPAGLAAWIVEKFNAWSDGGVERAFTKDEILTNLSIYYFTDTIATAVGTYAENTRLVYATGAPQAPAKVEVPTAVTSFPAETVQVAEDWAKRNANVQRFTKMPKGGHFAALEVPEAFAEDVTTSIAELTK